MTRARPRLREHRFGPVFPGGSPPRLARDTRPDRSPPLACEPGKRAAARDRRRDGPAGTATADGAPTCCAADADRPRRTPFGSPWRTPLAETSLGTRCTESAVLASACSPTNPDPVASVTSSDVRLLCDLDPPRWWITIPPHRDREAEPGVDQQPGDRWIRSGPPLKRSAASGPGSCSTAAPSAVLTQDSGSGHARDSPTTVFVVPPTCAARNPRCRIQPQLTPQFREGSLRDSPSALESIVTTSTAALNTDPILACFTYRTRSQRDPPRRRRRARQAQEPHAPRQNRYAASVSVRVR